MNTHHIIYELKINAVSLWGRFLSDCLYSSDVSNYIPIKFTVLLHQHRGHFEAQKCYVATIDKLAN